MLHEDSKTILLTGFEPFGSFRTNPSQQVVEMMNGKIVNSHKVIGMVVPVNFRTAFDPFVTVFENRVHPRIIISLGLKPSASVINIERVAINLEDYEGVPDNAGQTPVDEAIVTNGPAGIFATLPIRRILSNLQSSNIPAKISNSADAHLCNYIMYRVLYSVSKHRWDTKAGFIHLPPLQDDVTCVVKKRKVRSELSLQGCLKAVRIAIETTLDTQT